MLIFAKIIMMNNPEIDFILKATRFHLGEEEKNAIRAIARQIDERKMLEISRVHGLLAILDKSLYLNELTDILSNDTITMIHKSHIRFTVKNEKKFDFMQNLPNIIGDFVILKGGQILPDVYDDTGIRLMSDLDIFVPEDRAIEVYNKLRKFGFRNHEEITPGSYKSKKLLNLSLRHGYANHLPSLDYGDIMIEIHCRLYGDDFHKTNEAAYNSSLPKSKEESRIRYLSPEYNLVFLCKHFYNHGSNRKFYQLIDIREFISKYDSQIDWDKVDEIAETTKLRNAVAYTLNVLNQHFGAKIEDRYIDCKQIDINEMLKNDVMKNKKEKFKDIFSKAKNPLVFVVVIFSETFPSPQWLNRKYGKGTFRSYLIYLRNWFSNK